jgi:ribose transport system substrate-binding protein
MKGSYRASLGGGLAIAMIAAAFTWAHAEESKMISSVGRIGDASELITIDKVCGDKPIRVALVDGFGGNSWRRITRAEFEDEAAKCANIKEIIYVDGQNNPQKTISDLQGLVAQGVEAIVVFPDAGPAMLPAIRQAFKAGTSIVAYTASPGGTPGQDYVDFIAPNTPNDGASWAQWIADQLGGKGKVVFLGGTPGNLQSQAELEGIQKVFAKYPDIELLGGRPIDTNWDPAETQKVVAGLLTQYPQIDGIISDYGGGSVGGIRAFLTAGRPLPAWAANDANEFACLWYDNKDANPNYKIMTVSSRTWLVRVALRKALAHAQGI